MSVLSNQVNFDDWEQITSSRDVNNLINIFGGFSDCILIESRIWGDCYVDDELYIVYPQAEAADQKARAVFQRQGLNPKTIELLFIGLKAIQMKCRDSSNDGIINFATITDDCGLGDRSFIAKASDDPEAELIAAIRARSIYWRVLED